ncbi:Hypothetical protein EHI5A_057740 [Entamoeba histolytica KU27]|uniref:TRAF-type domain-containing protein n=1 Tax=Entamoeba histolytica KU27 TaxID=885311 RepID=M2RKF5_ENTHI|nr:Hypothetical protein EHI5A_057740 [Entamoeba histolytica KU27]
MTRYYPVLRYNLLGKTFGSDAIFIPQSLYQSFAQNSKNERIFVTLKPPRSNKIVPAVVEGPSPINVIFISDKLLPGYDTLSVQLVQLQEVTSIRFEAMNMECCSLKNIIEPLQSVLKFYSTLYVNELLEINVSSEEDNFHTITKACVVIKQLQPSNMVYISQLMKDINIDYDNPFLSNTSPKQSFIENGSEEEEEDTQKSDTENVSTKVQTKNIFRNEKVASLNDENHNGKIQCLLCGLWVSENKLKIHQSQCKKLTTKCPICSAITLKDKLNEHAKLHSLGTCPQCHIKCELLSMDRHINGSCDKKVIECEKCGWVMFQSDKKSHQSWCDKTIVDAVNYIRNEIIVKQYGEPSQHYEPPNDFDSPHSSILNSVSKKPFMNYNYF